MCVDVLVIVVDDDDDGNEGIEYRVKITTNKCIIRHSMRVHYVCALAMTIDDDDDEYDT